MGYAEQHQNSYIYHICGTHLLNKVHRNRKLMNALFVIRNVCNAKVHTQNIIIICTELINIVYAIFFYMYTMKTKSHGIQLSRLI